MLDVSVSVKPGEPHTIWLDTRDRILPDDKGLYLTIAGAGADFGAASLEGAEIRLVFKARQAGAAPSTSSTASPRCATTTPTSSRSRRARAA